VSHIVADPAALAPLPPALASRLRFILDICFLPVSILSAAAAVPALVPALDSGDSEWVAFPWAQYIGGITRQWPYDKGTNPSLDGVLAQLGKSVAYAADACAAVEATEVVCSSNEDSNDCAFVVEKVRLTVAVERCGCIVPNPCSVCPTRSTKTFAAVTPFSRLHVCDTNCVPLTDLPLSDCPHKLVISFDMPPKYPVFAPIFVEPERVWAEVTNPVTREALIAQTVCHFAQIPKKYCLIRVHCSTRLIALRLRTMLICC